MFIDNIDNGTKQSIYKNIIGANGTILQIGIGTIIQLPRNNSVREKLIENLPIYY